MQIVSSIRTERGELPAWFDCAQIDGILRTIRQVDPRSSQTRAPAVELTSIAPQGGKTHLLYLLTSIAVTAAEHGGREACVAIVDADDSFDVHRLAQHIRLRLQSRASNAADLGIDTLTRSALDHVYILKARNAADITATVAGLPEWFLYEKHQSSDRALAFIAIDSINALNFPASARSNVRTDRREGTSSSYTAFDAALRSSFGILQCPIILTTRYQGILPTSKDNSMPRSLRPDFMTALPPVLRLIVRQVPVRNIPSGLSTQETARETEDRLKIIALGRFECVVNEYGLEARLIQALYAAQDGFFFRIKQEGLTMESTEESRD